MFQKIKLRVRDEEKEVIYFQLQSKLVDQEREDDWRTYIEIGYLIDKLNTKIVIKKIKVENHSTNDFINLIDVLETHKLEKYEKTPYKKKELENILNYKKGFLSESKIKKLLPSLLEKKQN